MRSYRFRGGFFAFGAAMAFAATSAFLFISGCNSSATGPTGPTDTSEILLVYPKGGESFKIGSTLTVKWTEQGQGKINVNAVDVLFSPDAGKTWIYLNTRSIKPGDAQWENFAWVIPDALNDPSSGQFALANNAKCRIKVDQYTDPSSIFETSKDFTITP